MDTSNVDPTFEALLNYLKKSRGFDFSGYKPSSLMRRMTKRMQAVEINNYSDYVDYLEVHPEEFANLCNTILINVTAFFRDRGCWDYLSSEIIPLILARKEPYEPIRIWSAACASGEEAYTLAIVLSELLGADKFRERVKIYATDIDEEALNQARQGSYAVREMVGIPLNIRQAYFDRNDERYVFRKDLRRSVIFGRHNLIQDAPISRIDLLVCRNTLMYFNAEAQAKILARFHFAINNGGFLFLGKAEMLLSHTNTFNPADIKRRIFSKVPKINLRDRLAMMTQPGKEEPIYPLSTHGRIREAVFDTNPVAQIIVDLTGCLVMVNERARSLFNLTNRIIGRPLKELEISYRPAELHSGIERIYIERRPLILGDIQWQTPVGELCYLDVHIAPLQDLNNTLLGASITFADVTRAKRLQEDLEHSNLELEMAYEELQSTNEELETTNEELQSTVEELETTNGELQSTNEELETMNEELQSTNEELQTMNDEVRLRSDELNQINAFLESILTSLRNGVVVLDRDLHVQIWNDKAEDLWGLRRDEVLGKHFLNLDIGLPVEQLRQSIRACLAGEFEYNESAIEATNRRGKAIQCKVACTPLVDMKLEIRGIILLMNEQAD